MIDDLRMAAPMHDIGKLAIPDDILLSPGPLTADEFTSISEHTVLGERILAPLVRENPTVLSIVRSHHERVDGEGFPDRLEGSRIPWAARIVAVADAFDAMTRATPHGARRTTEEALAELEACSGSQFDPKIVRLFVAEYRLRGHQLPK